MADVRENFEEKYTKIIENFQQKLMDADNFHGGDRPDYKEFWQAWRQQGPAMLNLTKELMSYFQDTDNWYKENKFNDLIVGTEPKIGIIGTKKNGEEKNIKVTFKYL